MCQQLISCPLCARATFESLDSLRVGLVSVATRPLACPVCHDTVLGIDKLTIHLFGHTINAQEQPVKPVDANLADKVHTPVLRACCVGQELNSHVMACSALLQHQSSADCVEKSLMDTPSLQQLVDQPPAWEKELLMSPTPEATKDSQPIVASISAERGNDVMLVESVNRLRNLTRRIPNTRPNASATLTTDEKPCEASNSTQVLPQLKNLRVQTNEKTERCDICGFHFSDHNILTLHKQLVHMIGEKDFSGKPEVLLNNYPCHLCSKIFKMRGSLMVHMRVAHTGYSLGSLSRDTNTDEARSDSGFNCPTCGKIFRKEQHVMQHLKTHGGKQWACDVCSKMFTTKYFLKKHKRLHSGEMPYKCTICSKTFTFQQSYHKHRLYHKDDKPHTCATCGRSFKELSTLHNHERIHTGEKPFACETCGKRFRQRVSYLVHRRIHTGVMPYSCSTCGKSFRYKVSQRTHKCPGQTMDVIECQSDVKAEPEAQKNGLQLGLAELQSFSQLSDDNKYIVVVNDGQPVLKKQNDVDLMKNVVSSCDNVLERLHTPDSDDFFSFIPADLSLPSSEMKQLRLSSPTSDNQEDFACSNLQKDIKHAIDGILNDQENSLETINEESLKQLLYSIDKK